MTITDRAQAAVHGGKASCLFETIGSVPTEAATSHRDLTKSTLDLAKVRGVSMADPHNIRNHTFAESVLALPPGEWRVIRGVRHYIADPIRLEIIPAKVPVKASCGTPSGYNRHRYDGEEVCAECRRAIRDRTRAQRQKRREAAAGKVAA